MEGPKPFLEFDMRHLGPPSRAPNLFPRYKDLLFPLFKDRRHRTSGGFGVSFIIHEPRGVEYHVIYQMEAMIVVYVSIFDNTMEIID